jgi:hypothetical protein
MVLLDVLGHTVQYLCDGLEVRPCAGKTPMINIGLHEDPLSWSGRGTANLGRGFSGAIAFVLL